MTRTLPYVLTICALLLTTFSFGQKDEDDSMLIKQLLMREILVLDHCAFDQFQSYWKESPYIYISVYTQAESYVLNSWADFVKWIHKTEKRCVPGDRTHTMDKYSINIKNDLAFVTYRQDNILSGKVIVEKVNVK